MEELNTRIHSKVPGPVSDYGYMIRPAIAKTVTYNGQFLPAFLYKHNVDPSLYPQLLLMNQIGSVFKDLEPGMTIQLPPSNDDVFLKHPDA